MNIIIDLLIVVVLGLTVAVISARSPLRALSCFLAVVLALVGAAAFSPLLVPAVREPIQKGLINQATTVLAELAQIPNMENAEATLEKIDYRTVLGHHTEELESMAEEFHVAFSELKTARNATEAVERLTEPLASSIVQAVLFILLLFVLFLVFLAVLHFILFQNVAKAHLKRKFNFVSCVIGCAAAILLVVYGVLPLLETFRPYSVGILQPLKLDTACAYSKLYALFEKCDFLSLLFHKKAAEVA